MNIAVQTQLGKVFVRPDVTLERNSEDFYPPEYIDALSFTPCLYLRVCRPGKSVAAKFAHRYVDAFSFGILLYGENLIGTYPEAFATASCLDHTSFLPLSFFPLPSDGIGEGFTIGKDGVEIFNSERIVSERIDASVANITSYVPIRNGDILALELDSRKLLCRRGAPVTQIKGTYANEIMFDFKIPCKL